MTTAPTREQIGAALARVRPHVHRTPVMTTDTLLPGRSIQVKLENTQKTGSFKVRGAFDTLLTSEVPPAGVVAASGGNHGAAVAHAAKALGIPARIYVPEMAGPTKIGLIEATGADLVVVEGVYADALARARDWEAEHGAMQIHAYDAPGTVEGQGTCFAEWDEQGLDAETVLIAVGGGGLIGGALSWFDGARKVVAVEPEQAPTLNAALAAGEAVDVDVSGIAANALGARRIGDICLGLAQRHGVQSALVPDAAIADAQQVIWQGLRQFVEPAAAAALAALRCGAYVPRPDEEVAVLICGANPAPGPFG